MHRLFWKIFFLFWIVNAGVFAFGLLIASLYHDTDDRARYSIENTAQRAIEAYENDELEAFYQRSRKRRNSVQFLLDENKQLLPEGYVASEPVPELSEYPWESTTRKGFKFLAVKGIEIESRAGDKYHFITRYNPRRHNRPPFLFPLFLIAIAATSMFLAAYITHPLRKLQSVVRRFASGDHDARVPRREAARQDVVGEVGREFNVMAERLKAQLESQRRLLRDISHELRTPLARMQVAVAIAEDSSSGAEGPHARLHTEIERLDTLIGQVLALSRIESGADHLSKETFVLRGLINDIATDAEYEFSGKNKKLVVHVPAAISIEADKSQLQSAIENVIRNAMRYTPEDSQVEVDAELLAPSDNLSGGTGSVQICIRDHGPGVLAANLPKLFDAFYREDDSRDTGSGGHGVGLAISRTIVVAHGGSISAVNHSEGGLQVDIVLPLTSGNLA